MKIEDQKELQSLLNKKQKWIQKAIQEVQKGNYEKATLFVNLDSGFNVSIIKMLETYYTVSDGSVDSEPEPKLEEDETTYEDVNPEDEEGR